jgi:Superinfection immunity protein
MNTLVHSSDLWVSLITGLVLLYFLPTMIGIIRKVESLGLLIFLNVLPTGVGWLAAMVTAFMLPRREPPLTYIPCQYLPQYQQAPRGCW